MMEVLPNQDHHRQQFNSVILKTDNGTPPMYKERNRLNSYQNWPCTYLTPPALAKAGFFYTQNSDIVRCAFCAVEVGRWEPGDDAMVDHKKWSGHCRFVCGLPCGNIPIEEDNDPTSSAQDVCGKYGIEVRPNSFPEREGSTSGGGGSGNLNLSKLGVQPNYAPSYPGFATLEKRLSSFAEWPRSMKQKPKELAAAGFFYSGLGDQTICFQCGGGLKDWEDGDDPWEQHARWFSKCNFVLLQKGHDYISEICNRQEPIITAEDAAGLQLPSISDLNITPVTSKPSTSPQFNAVCNKPKEINTQELASVEPKQENTNTLCKICYSKEVGVVFLPCGHIVACVDCAPALTTCAVCRKPLEATVRAFLS